MYCYVTIGRNKFEVGRMKDSPLKRYYQHVINLFDLLHVANSGDSDNKVEPWVTIRDASYKHLFGHIATALEEIAGEEIVRVWGNSGEIQLDLIPNKVIQSIPIQVSTK